MPTAVEAVVVPVIVVPIAPAVAVLPPFVVGVAAEEPVAVLPAPVAHRIMPFVHVAAPMIHLMIVFADAAEPCAAEGRWVRPAIALAMPADMLIAIAVAAPSVAPFAPAATAASDERRLLRNERIRNRSRAR